MMSGVTVSNQQFHSLFIERVQDRQNAIRHWLGRYAQSHELPLYSSVDIRDSGAKITVVDTNLFPAGFNNLCEHGIADAITHFGQAIRSRAPLAKNILIIAEEHTRNTWYLENVRVLRDIITQAGFNARIATFLDIQPAFCQNVNYVELRTATDLPVKVHCLKKLINDITLGQEQIDLIILNNDLTSGIPEVLLRSTIPIYPSLRAGWHSRLKSHHFSHTNDLIKEFARILDLDPWFFPALLPSRMTWTSTARPTGRGSGQARVNFLTGFGKNTNSITSMKSHTS
ncbi:MAG: glutamate--cysteine ligase [Pirellulales bacterium]|nr:glutamate--cysteine ligase [Pirellulales bacterium]